MEHVEFLEDTGWLIDLGLIMWVWFKLYLNLRLLTYFNVLKFKYIATNRHFKYIATNIMITIKNEYIINEKSMNNEFSMLIAFILTTFLTFPSIHSYSHQFKQLFPSINGLVMPLDSFVQLIFEHTILNLQILPLLNLFTQVHPVVLQRSLNPLQYFPLFLWTMCRIIQISWRIVYLQNVSWWFSIPWKVLVLWVRHTTVSR